MTAPVVLSINDERAAVVRVARTWLKTPYVHHQSLKHAGTDCAHFLMAVFAEAELIPAVAPGYYAAEWFLHDRVERFLNRVESVCIKIETPTVGDLALFRVGRVTAHGGILTGPNRIIHADRHAGLVVEETLDETGSWKGRLTGFWSLARWQYRDE